MTDVRVKGMDFKNKQSAMYAKEDTDEHYFNKKNDIYRDKVSKFVVKCNTKCNGLVMSRLEDIYTHIFIDEIQDMAGYDFEVIQLLFETRIRVVCAGDPRQRTYLTNNSQKYKNMDIFKFIDKNCKDTCEVDDSTLSKSHRCNKEVCAFASKLYPDMPPTESDIEASGNDEGIIIVRRRDVDKYLSEYNPVQLRYDRNAKVSSKYRSMNFGEAKGITLERVLIIPTSNMEQWIFNNLFELKDSIKSKFYVAITRAKKSAAILVNDAKNEPIEGVKYYLRKSQKNLHEY